LYVSDLILGGKSKGIYLEEISQNYVSSKIRVDYKDYLDESMYRGPREYNKQIKREKKTFKLKRFNFFWHYNPELFATLQKKQKKKSVTRGVYNSDELYEQLTYPKIKNKRLKRRKNHSIQDSPDDSYLIPGSFNISSNRIKSKRIKNRLLKNYQNPESQEDDIINIDFNDDRFVISQPRRNPQQRCKEEAYVNTNVVTHGSDLSNLLNSNLQKNALEQYYGDQPMKLIEEKPDDDSLYEMEQDHSKNIKKEESLSSISKDIKTSKKQKNRYKTPQMYSNVIHHSHKTNQFEDQRETVKKGQQMVQCNELFKESPKNNLNDNIIMVRHGVLFDVKSPTPNLKKKNKNGFLKNNMESVPYETPRAEFGVNKTGDSFEQHDSMFNMKKNLANFSKSPLFCDSKFQNLKTTTKKYSSKNFDFLNPENTKSPNMKFKPNLIQDTPENGILKVPSNTLDKGMEFIKLSEKELAEYKMSNENKSSNTFVDTSFKRQPAEPFPEKLRKYSNSMLKPLESMNGFQDFVENNDFSEISKIYKYGNMKERNSQFSLIKAENPLENSANIQTPIKPDRFQKISPEEIVTKSKLGSAKKGCFCKQTECLKNYCSCFKYGEFCSTICECKNCENHENSERRERKIKSIALKSQSCSDRKRDKRNRHQEMREMFDSRISETLRNKKSLEQGKCNLFFFY
jgi:hypothetical protein